MSVWKFVGRRYLWRECFSFDYKTVSMSTTSKMIDAAHLVEVPTEHVRLPKKVKKALRKASRKKAEKQRLAEKKSQHRINSLTNNSDVLSTENLLSAPYYYDHATGLRKVYPYTYKFSNHAKGRWYGKTVLEILTKEFNRPDETVLNILESGRFTVNGKLSAKDYKFKDNDLVAHTVHRHELPVTAEPLEILENTDELLVINKPCSIPVHPCGKYRYNSLTYILAIEHGLKNLRVIYRIDRMTSGVVIFPKLQGLANAMCEDIKNRRTEKTYLCRVEGEFPAGVVECNEPLQIFDHGIGLHYVSPTGKQSHTTFERLSYNGRSSVVKCQPHTGRTHQIRVHLQYLGHPILNDFFYNTDAWGPQKGKHGEYGKSQEQLLLDLRAYHTVMKNLKPVADKTLGPSQENSLSLSLNHEQSQQCSDSTGNETAQNCDVGTSEAQSMGSNSCDRILERENDNIKGIGRSLNDKSTVLNLTCENVVLDCSAGNSNKHKNDSLDSNVEQKGKKIKLDTESSLTSFNEADIVSTNNTVQSCKSSNDNLVPSGSINQNKVPPPFDPEKITYDESCEECQRSYIDPQSNGLIMYLHAWRNKGPTWDFSTTLPKWAHADWNE